MYKTDPNDINECRFTCKLALICTVSMFTQCTLNNKELYMAKKDEKWVDFNSIEDIVEYRVTFKCSIVDYRTIIEEISGYGEIIKEESKIVS